jgi:hypothetical protein
MAQSVYRLCTDWKTKGLEFESRWGHDFSLLHVVRTGFGAHPAAYPMGIGGCFPGPEADHSPPSSAEVKNVWVYVVLN